MRLLMKLDELSAKYLAVCAVNKWPNPLSECTYLLLYHFTGYVCILIAWGSIWCHNSYQTVIIIWLHLVHEHDTQCKLNFTQMNVQKQFTNKCSFYITLSIDLLFDCLPLMIITFTQMAVQMPFMSNCSFYINFSCWYLIRSFYP